MKQIIPILLLMLMFMSCEQVVDVSTLPHKEKIFVEGILSPDQDIEIVCSRTLPPLDTTFDNDYQIDSLQTRITDIQGTIAVDGITYPLEHIGFGRYRIVDAFNQSIKGKPGSSYQLQATWKELNINANTTIPLMPTTRIVSSIIDTQKRVKFSFWGREYLKVSIETESTVHPNETWTLSINTENAFTLEVLEFFERDPTIREDSTFFDLGYRKYLLAKNTPHRSKFIVYLNADMQSNAQVLASYASSKLIIRSFDKAWKSYIDTQFLGYGFDGIFGGSESGIQWNIKGDGLGLFIGKNEAQIPLQL
jgi:hypothetical protein